MVFAVTASGTRRYDASRRRAAAEVARQRILAAATARFIAQGYAATTVAQVAADAEVSAQTVFTRFGSKVNLLKEAVDVAIVGDPEQAGLHDRPAMQHVYAGPTAPDVLRRFASVIAAVAERACPIALVAYAAADADPEIAQLTARLDQQRLLGAAALAALVADRSGDVDPARVDAIRDSIWALNSPLQYRLLVVERGWTVARYAAWIEQALLALAGTGRTAGGADGAAVPSWAGQAPESVAAGPSASPAVIV
jgi:AcrR family transcriptional regulator